jgi:hypothetical protein
MMTTMPIAGQLIRKCGAFSSHPGNPEAMLIRVGHYLWKLYKQAKKNQRLTDMLDAALESVWEVKRLYRAPLQIAKKEARERFAAREPKAA